jgi:hypothetical protein
MASLDQLADQRGRSGEAHAVSTLAGCQAKSQSDVRFARAAVAQQQNVLAAGKELSSRQFQHQDLVQHRYGEEVEAVHGLDDWELRLPDATFGGPAFAVQQLQFGHAQQVALIVQLLDCALAGHSVVLSQDSRQPQFLQMVFQQKLRCVGCVSCSVGNGDIDGTDAHISASKVM